MISVPCCSLLTTEVGTLACGDSAPPPPPAQLRGKPRGSDGGAWRSSCASLLPDAGDSTGVRPFSGGGISESVAFLVPTGQRRPYCVVCRHLPSRRAAEPRGRGGAAPVLRAVLGFLSGALSALP